MAARPNTASDALDTPQRIWTIGHSTLALADFMALLRSRNIALLADVRRFPASRRHPQFNRESLPASLAAIGIDYLHLAELGGRRRPRPDTPNTGWRLASFRGYADYMQTEAFHCGFSRLLDAAAPRRCAIMCAERAWQSCHRGLISDLLKSLGVSVVHIVDGKRDEEHPYTKPARIVGGVLSYAADAAAQSNAQSKLDL
jgi:uncharacterized protein (DUF488 family)